MKMFSHSCDCNVVIIDELFSYFDGKSYKEDEPYNPIVNIMQEQRENERE